MSDHLPERKSARCYNKLEIILAFAIPFLFASVAWTIIDYVQVEEKLEKESVAGVTPTTSDSEIWFQAVQKSLLVAIPAGALGVGALVALKKSQSKK